MQNIELINSIQSSWVQLRDKGALDDLEILDILMGKIGLAGSPGYDCGIRDTFSIFSIDDDAKIFLPTGELTKSDEEARFIANILAIRLFLAAGFGFEAKIINALASTYAMSWAKKSGNNYGHSALTLAMSIWLIALEPKPESDEPFPINWDIPCFDNPEIWNFEFNLHSRYDIRERILDWCILIVNNTTLINDVSIFTILEPILYMKNDFRAKLFLDKFSELQDHHESSTASTLMEKKRIVDLINNS
jgi:hypothetical protein